MKSRTVEKEGEEVSYPRLMQSIKSGVVMIAQRKLKEYTLGIVVFNNGSGFELGEIANIESCNLIDFNGDVVLSNK